MVACVSSDAFVAHHDRDSATLANDATGAAYPDVATRTFDKVVLLIPLQPC